MNNTLAYSEFREGWEPCELTFAGYIKLLGSHLLNSHNEIQWISCLSVTSVIISHQVIPIPKAKATENQL